MSRGMLFAVAFLAAGCGKSPAPVEPAPEPTPTVPVVQEVVPPKPRGEAKEEADELPTKTAAVSALTGKINLPKDGGRWPWKLAGAPPAVEGKAVKLTLTDGRSFLAVSPESGRFVYAQIGGKVGPDKSQSFVTRYVFGDVTAGAVLAEWELKDHIIPLDVSPDGKRIVATNMWRDAKLTVFTLSPEFQLSRRTTVAHDRIVLNPAAGSGPDKDLHVAWAAFVGNDRVASAAEGGQVRVFNAATLQKVGTLDGTPHLAPTVTPDRRRLVAHAGGQVVLVDPAEGYAVGTPALALPAGEKKLAISPDGATLACAKDGRVRFLSLTTGEVWDQVIPRLGGGGGMQNQFSWAGSGFLACGRELYDPALPYPVWHHTQPDAEALTPRQLWAAVRTPGFTKKGETQTATVRPFDHVPPDLRGIVDAGKGRPGIYTLAPWSKVRADVSKLPPAVQANVRADLEQRLKDVGYVPDPAANTLLTASLDAAETRNTKYANLTNVPYTYQPLRLQFRHQGKVVWEQVMVKQAPFTIFVPGGQTLAQKVAAEGYGRPDYVGIRTAPIPPDVPGPAFPERGFGTTLLSADGPHFQPAH